MKISNLGFAFAAVIVLAGSGGAFAAEGAATGNATSTPAGPAGDNSGPTKSGTGTSSSMTGNHSMSSGSGGTMRSGDKMPMTCSRKVHPSGLRV